MLLLHRKATGRWIEKFIGGDTYGQGGRIVKRALTIVNVLKRQPRRGLTPRQQVVLCDRNGELFVSRGS